ncbi:DUF885 domain-containing protein [Microbacterium sp. P5_E9]
MAQPPTTTAHEMDTESAARELLDATWRVVSETPLVARALGRTLEQVPDIGIAAISRRTREGKDIVARIDRLDTAALPADLALDLSVARTLATGWTRSEDWYWLAFDPLGDGFFSMFAPSAYSGAFVLNIVHEALESASVQGPADVERHLELIGDYGGLVRQLTERTAGQADRGIHMPAAQLDRALPLVVGLKDVATKSLRAVSERSLGILSPAALSRIQRRITAEVEPAFDDLLGLLGSADYAARAPESVGLGSYPGGAEIYEQLVGIHTTQPLSADEVHERGHTRMARIEDEMRALVASVGFDGSPEAYHAALAEDPRWRASTDEDIAAHFQRYIDRFAPEADKHFGTLPDAGYSVAPLPSAVSGSMTFGYYSPPQPDRESGVYFFNGANLSKASLSMVATLVYHELVPGHHLHLALQHETTDLHPLRRHSGATAFTEGWAEYAARFAGEIGMYREPEERFGRLVMEAFLTSRLVVDTGMNAFGWSLERGRDYMRAHSFMGETEIESETLRYSCDIPAQALAYKLGDDFLHRLREDIRAELGEDFRVADFHGAVLDAAGLPLPLVERQVRGRML